MMGASTAEEEKEKNEGLVSSWHLARTLSLFSD